MSISDDGMSSTESVGFGSQMGSSFKSILVGLVAFPLSFYFIFKVETCTQAGDAFKNAKPISQMQEGKPVYITGKLQADELKNQFIKEGKYISAQISPSVYAWDEETKTKGSGSSKTTTRECKLIWTSSPENPNNFTLPKCKEMKFFQPTVKESKDFAQNGKLTQDGVTYSVDLSKVDFTSDLAPDYPEEASIIKGKFHLGTDKYLYSDKKCETEPYEGCEKISLTVVKIPQENMTFLGSVKDKSLEYFEFEDTKFMSASIGDYVDTMKDIKSDDSTTKWMGRIGSFIVMWLALVALVGPITTLLDFIPFIGDLGRFMVMLLMGIVAFVLTTVTILLVKFWYVWLILLLGSVGFGLYKQKNKSIPSKA